MKLVPRSFGYIKPGDIYGRLTVTATYGVEGTYRYMATCDCSCGTKNVLVRIDGLRSKTRKTSSCGCAQRDAVTTHGAWGNPLFTVWKGMMSRCYKPQDKRYSQYGGRGISVCDRWHNINIFIDDMSSSYRPNLQLDRIDNDGSYSPENCKWSTRTEQARNKSNNIKLTFEGQTKCLSEWAEITGICIGTLWDRLIVRKWDTMKTLTTPPMSHKESTLLARNTRYGKL